MRIRKEGFIWVIAYVNRKFLDTLQEDLNSNGFEEVTSYVPMIRVLKKCFKNKKEYEDIPMLFNFGFLQIPEQMVYNPVKLREMQRLINGIHGWVKDPARMLYDEDADSTIGIHNISVVTPREIRQMRRSCKNMSIFNDLELGDINKGDEISLKGYPFDGLVGTIVKIDKEEHKIELDLIIGTNPTKVTVDFENVFYTVYEDYEDKPMREDSLEELSGYGPRVIDKLYANLIYEQEEPENEWD